MSFCCFKTFSFNAVLVVAESLGTAALLITFLRRCRREVTFTLRGNFKFQDPECCFYLISKSSFMNSFSKYFLSGNCVLGIGGKAEDKSD